MRRSIRLVGLLAVVLLVPAPVLAAGVEGVAVRDLDNGLRVVVREDRRAPVVVNQIWYRVGSIDEYRGVTGVSHALEHMMFKATDELESGEFSRRVARRGGRDNAFTSRYYTGYYQQVAAGHVEMLLEMEADRMRDLVLRADEFAREIRVVREERSQRIDDQPRSLLWERIRATAFPSSPARQPIIGWSSDLAAMTVADLEQWYDQWYGPNNAVLVVAGDVDAERVFALAETHFGAIEPIDLPDRLPQTEIEPDGESRLEVHAQARVPYVGLAWRLPSLTTLDDPADAHALRVLAGVLDGGRSARIESNIVRTGIAAGAGAGYSPFTRGQALFTAAGTPADDRSVEELEEALRAEVERLKDEPIEAAELERVRTGIRADEVFQLDSVFGQARRLAMLEILGLGHESWPEYLDGLAAVDAEDVRRVARQYLVDRRLTVGTLVPEARAGSAGAVADPAGPVEEDDRVEQ